MLADVAALIRDDQQAADTLLDYLRERDGSIGFLLRTLSRRPEVFVPHVMQGFQLYETPKAIEPKMAELAALFERIMFDPLSYIHPQRLRLPQQLDTPRQRAAR